MQLECGGEEGDAVQVAVRMRVFNGREKAANAERIVRMENLDKGSKTYITDPDTREERDFKYDFSFQSHSETEPGIGEWATQDTVMKTLGIPVLNAALEGRNVSLFAYGQTGAGKSFSMLGKVGVPELEGIIPRSCKEIFRLIKENTDPNVQITVDIQVVEVYCEQINDLLCDRKQWPANGHKPRLTPKFGYVVDTTTKPCFTYDDIWSAMEFADKNRSVGSHALNPESSRAHTIYQINYQKVSKNDSGKILETVSAKLNLIDLAGSERTDSAGTTGQMLKEGNAINLSLTALGGCIKSLSEGKKPNFRDSKLTLLLQASMTGGKVIMIAALSPASICYAETLSTLKFADRIKQVKIKSTKNVSTDPVAEMKKAMEELRAKLQSEIDQLKAAGATGGLVADPAKVAELQSLLEEKREAEKKMQEDLLSRIRELEEGSGGQLRREQAQKINNMQAKAFQGISTVRAEEEKRPHFVNLHDDPRLAETLVYPFNPGKTLIGRMNKESPPDIEFNGMGIIKDHCVVEYDDGNKTVYITPSNNSRTLVNGKKITARTQLIHQNRVWLGNNYAMRFCFPGQEAHGEGLQDDPDYFHAEAEVQEHSAGKSASTSKGKGLDMLTNELRHKLAEAERKIDQANIIASDLEKEVIFAPKIYENRLTKDTDVVVAVNFGGFSTLIWPWAKFNVRLADMVTMWTEWQQMEAMGQDGIPHRDSDSDPFTDKETQLIGEADVWLNALANMVEFQANTAVLSYFGQVEGKVRIELQPCDRNGNPGPWKEEEDDLDPFVDDPEELLGKDIIFEVRVHDLTLDVGGGVCRYKKTFIRYKFDLSDENEEWSITREDPSATFNPKYKYTKKHKVKVTPSVLKHITNGKMTFQLWGIVTTHDERPGTSDGKGGGIATRLEAKRKEVEKLEAQLQQKEKVLAQKEAQIAEKRRILASLGS
eukprot:NODE_259_length_3123_cov_69.608000_g188_i1.p1 GENE.NODE_259_length_3123_cov_69.608000_g188_i1~~NODE_259_length_3123_cov_69.608000_g188_i1.p1  ORF type:complete len:939 (-),score=219.60 NODE_259_length_3123_cov_69.608000_g188_i1:262-3078(-)